MIAVRLDRCFRSAVDALNVIEGFKRRRITLVLLDLGDCTGNGVSELIVTVPAACAQFEHHLISEWIAATKANLRRAREKQKPGSCRQRGDLNGYPRFCRRMTRRRVLTALALWSKWCGPRSR